MANSASDIYHKAATEVENIKIPIWKLVDANYQYPTGTDADPHHNGYIFAVADSDFTGPTFDAGSGCDIYAFALPYAYSSSTYVAYKDSDMSELSKVTTFTAADQSRITSAGVLEVSVTFGGSIYDIWLSPSDFTRIDASGGEFLLGSNSFGELVVGAEYNSQPSFGYIKTGDITKNDAGEIKSPFTWLGAGIYAVANKSNKTYASHRIASCARDVNMLRSLGLSSSSFVKVTSGVEKTFLSGAEVGQLEFDFKSNQNGAYLRIKNNNAFDVFIYSIEIWGLWAVKQSATDKYGGGLTCGKFVDDNKNATTKSDFTNNYIRTAEQGEEVAAYYYEVLCKNATELEDVNVGPLDYYEIGDQLSTNSTDISSATVKFIVIGKKKSKNGVSLTLRRVDS